MNRQSARDTIPIAAMADRRRKQNFPNLKICVENTDESSENSSSDSESSASSTDTDTSDSESSSDSSESENDDDVQFRVKIGNVQDRLQPKRAKDVSHEDSEEDNSDTDVADKRTASIREQSVNAPIPAMAPKVYENKSGEFYTGIDMNTKEAQEKIKERAKRFGIESEDIKNKDIDLKTLYESLKIKEEDVHKTERGIRLNAIHIRGLENMSTQDVFNYFGIFAPGSIEWIDDFSCNVVWLDSVSAARAMFRLSKSFEEVKNEEKKQEEEKDEKNTEKEDEKMEEDEVKEPSEKKENDSKQLANDGGPSEDTRDEEAMEEDDDNLDLTETSDINLEKSKSTPQEPSNAQEVSENNNTENVADKEVENEKAADDQPEKDSNNVENAPSSAEEGEIVDSDTDGDSNKYHLTDRRKKKNYKEIGVSWPPGYWRLGVSSSKGKHLFLRFATKADKKVPGAERKSKYYQKYGNPNYGGMTGLISGSRKRKLRQKKIYEEIESVKKVVEETQEARQKEEEILRDSDDDKRLVNVKDSDLEENGDDGAAPPVDEEELEKLMGHPAKRKMRMYADDLEDEIKKKRVSGGLKIVTGAKQRLSNRKPTDARQKLQDLRSANYYDRDHFYDDFDDHESVDSDDEDSYHGSSYHGTDLRTKLQSRRNRTSGFPSMKIEISEG